MPLWGNVQWSSIQRTTAPLPPTPYDPHLPTVLLTLHPHCRCLSSAPYAPHHGATPALRSPQGPPSHAPCPHLCAASGATAPAALLPAAQGPETPENLIRITEPLPGGMHNCTEFHAQFSESEDYRPRKLKLRPEESVGLRLSPRQGRRCPSHLTGGETEAGGRGGMET